MHGLQIEVTSFTEMADGIGAYVTSRPQEPAATAASGDETLGSPESRSELEETLSELREDAS